MTKEHLEIAQFIKPSIRKDRLHFCHHLCIEHVYLAFKYRPHADFYETEHSTDGTDRGTADSGMCLDLENI